jgi:hypothetical protein
MPLAKARRRQGNAKNAGSAASWVELTAIGVRAELRDEDGRYFSLYLPSSLLCSCRREVLSWALISLG